MNSSSFALRGASLVVGAFTLLACTGQSLDADAPISSENELTGDLSRDPSFGEGGLVELRQSAMSLAVHADGRIVVLEDRWGAKVLRRFLPDGQVDASFGGGPDFAGVGAKTIDRDHACLSGATSIVVDSAGRILVAGRANASVCVVRYKETGVVDASFAAAGVFTGPPTVDSSLIPKLAVAANGTVAVATTASPKKTNPSERFPAVTQILEIDGSGTLVSEHLPARSTLYMQHGLAYDAAGGLLVGGARVDGPHELVYPTVVRYLGGKLDASFGVGGIARPDFQPIAGTRGSYCTIAADPFGGSVAACELGALTDKSGLVRLSPAGEVDASFGDKGYATMSGFHPLLVVDGSHRTLAFVNGWVSPRSLATSSAAVRLTADGSPDTTFGPDGGRTFSGCAGCGFDHVAMQPSGSVVVAQRMGAARPMALSRFKL